MKPFTFKNVQFVKSAVQAKDYPTLRDTGGALLPEIAVAGRSNVGKSSLLNHLFRRKGLVKTSATPGKTRLLNFFSVDDQVAFVDLPGYGYAQVSAKVRSDFFPMVQNYLNSRSMLKLMLVLLDIRRLPNDDDKQLIDWILHTNKAMILVLTKVDKLSRGARQTQTRKILEQLGLTNLHYVHYSVLENEGRHALVMMLRDALTDEGENDGSL